MARKKNLFVCYVRLKDAHLCDERPVFSYAYSHCHAMNLAIKFCVDCWHWELNSFHVSKPILITSFAR